MKEGIYLTPLTLNKSMQARLSRLKADESVKKGIKKISWR